MAAALFAAKMYIWITAAAVAADSDGGADAVCEMQVKFDSNGGDRLETPESKIEAWAQSVKALL